MGPGGVNGASSPLPWLATREGTDQRRHREGQLTHSRRPGPEGSRLCSSNNTRLSGHIESTHLLWGLSPLEQRVDRIEPHSAPYSLRSIDIAQAPGKRALGEKPLPAPASGRNASAWLDCLTTGAQCAPAVTSRRLLSPPLQGGPCCACCQKFLATLRTDARSSGNRSGPRSPFSR